MTTLDLFAMARENADHLASECAKHTGMVVEFAQSVERECRRRLTRSHVRRRARGEFARARGWGILSTMQYQMEIKGLLTIEPAQLAKWKMARVNPADYDGWDGKLAGALQRTRYLEMCTTLASLFRSAGPFGAARGSSALSRTATPCPPA